MWSSAWRSLTQVSGAWITVSSFYVTLFKDTLLILDTDRTKLPLWRYVPRQRLIPLVRWETPHLAAMQKAMRSPALDTYFSTTANLGTHTFFMIFLPILFWCGYTNLGRGYGSRRIPSSNCRANYDPAWYMSSHPGFSLAAS